MYVLDDYNVGDVRNVLYYRDSALCSYCLCILPKSVMPFPYLQVPTFARSLSLGFLLAYFSFLHVCHGCLPVCLAYPCSLISVSGCQWYRIFLSLCLSFFSLLACVCSVYVILALPFCISTWPAGSGPTADCSCFLLVVFFCLFLDCL
jgi:hypothetical protein